MDWCLGCISIALKDLIIIIDEAFHGKKNYKTYLG